MTQETNAIEHLRVIRTLMERATVYRAISSPTALVGGLLSLAVCGINFFVPLPFVACWLVVLALTLVANSFFLWRDTSHEGRPIISSGLRLAIRAVLPSLVTAGVFSLPLLQEGKLHPTLATIWMVFYGLALLATEQFAPRSLVWLGRSFLAAGLVVLLATMLKVVPISADVRGGHLIMGASFGLFHLIYAAATWPRKSAADQHEPLG